MPGETSAADGEIVWSWRRDPGATLAVSPAGNGGKKGRFPGESTYNPKTPLRGEGRDVLAVPVKSVCVLYYPFAHGAAGAAGARLSLRPPLKREQTKLQNPDENESRE